LGTGFSLPAASRDAEVRMKIKDKSEKQQLAVAVSRDKG